MTSKKPDKLTQLLVAKLTMQGQLINTLVSTVADLLYVTRGLLGKCSRGCDRLSVGKASEKILCYRCCLETITAGGSVEWDPNRDAILRVEDGVESLKSAGYCDPEEMN